MPQQLSSTDRLFLALIASLSDDEKDFLLNSLRQINGAKAEEKAPCLTTDSTISDQEDSDSLEGNEKHE